MLGGAERQPDRFVDSRRCTMVASVTIVWQDGYVTSACGTHLGSFLPDAEGDRWCIDLSCVSGNPLTVN